MRRKILLATIIGVIAIGAFAYFVWPFRYGQVTGEVSETGNDHLSGRKGIVENVDWESEHAAALEARLAKEKKLLSDKADAKVARVVSDLTAIRVALELFKSDVGRYPTRREGLDSLRQAPEFVPAWHGPYLSKQPPLDPWGNEYVYEMPGSNGKDDYLIKSLGPDGHPGDTDDHSILSEGPG